MEGNNDIENAYHEFKGSTNWTNTPTARTVLANVSTARTHKWNGIDVVGVYLADDGEWVEECDEIVDRHNLEPVDVNEASESKRYFAPEGLAKEAERV